MTELFMWHFVKSLGKVQKDGMDKSFVIQTLSKIINRNQLAFTASPLSKPMLLFTENVSLI